MKRLDLRWLSSNLSTCVRTLSVRLLPIWWWTLQLLLLLPRRPSHNSRENYLLFTRVSSTELRLSEEFLEVSITSPVTRSRELCTLSLSFNCQRSILRRPEDKERNQIWSIVLTFWMKRVSVVFQDQDLDKRRTLTIWESQHWSFLRNVWSLRWKSLEHLTLNCTRNGLE